ncbi:MAG: hypothetical protein BPHS0_29 [Phage 5P_3]|nr:MAG: hypothetical protein BPHS0_29 [Phage 5P_3]
MARHTDASKIYGVSERQLFDEWQNANCALSLAAWLEAQYRACGQNEPLGGLDEAIMPDFDALARQIERVAA